MLLNRCIKIVFTFFFLQSALILANEEVAANKKVIAYYTGWSTYGRNYQVADIPAEKLTHINYAFANISQVQLDACGSYVSGGEVLLGDSYADIDKAFGSVTWEIGELRGNFGELLKLKAKYPQLKTLISIGGWTWSNQFSDLAATAEGRFVFAQSAVKFMKTYGFDGVDIDWEYPVSGGNDIKHRPEDKENFTLLMEALRQELTKAQTNGSEPYLLTIATSAGVDKISNLELVQVGNQVDWINVMTYDFHGAWESTTNHQSALYPNTYDLNSGSYLQRDYNIDSAIKAYLDQGLKPQQIVIGAPIYGRSWGGVSSVGDGLNQSSSYIPAGSWDDWSSGVTGVMDYSRIHALRNTSNFYWDRESQSSYLFYNGIFVTYDSVEAIHAKTKYIKDNKLAGIMFWELSGDSKNPEDSLVHTSYQDLYRR